MTTAHPRDPRLRRHRSPVDPLDAAVRLEVAVDAMRGAMRATPEELRSLDESLDELAVADVDPVDQLAADVAATAQLGTVEPPLTAQAFADALLDSPVLPVRGPDVAPPPPPPLEVFQTEHLDTLEVSPRALTWRSRHDERSRLFGVREHLAGSAPVVDRMWAVGPVIDQGAEGACVGAAVAGAVNVLRMAAAIAAGGPLSMLDLEDAVDLYERAKELDEVPGVAYSGTSVLAGLQAGVEARLIGGYLWAFGTRDVAQAVLQRGPVIVGVPWLTGMTDTGPGGLVELTGDDVGMGHCLVVVGIKRTGPQGQPGPYFVWQNSWGPGYGDGGLGYVHHRDLATLLRGIGEAAIPTRGAVTAATP